MTAKAPQWKRQRALKRKDIPSRNKMIAIMKQIPDPEKRAFYIISYLTAGRISEILPLKYKRKVTYAKETVAKDGKEVTRTKRNEHGSPIQEEVEREKINYSGVRRDNIDFQFKDGRRIMIVSMQNRKNPRRKRKRIPIPYDKEKEFLKPLEAYIKTKEIQEPLFTMSIRTAEKTIQEYANMNPHYLRDIRLSHLVINYDFNSFRLTKYAGWSDVSQAEPYVRLAVTDILGGNY